MLSYDQAHTVAYLCPHECSMPHREENAPDEEEEEEEEEGQYVGDGSTHRIQTVNLHHFRNAQQLLTAGDNKRKDHGAHSNDDESRRESARRRVAGASKHTPSF